MLLLQKKEFENRLSHSMNKTSWYVVHYRSNIYAFRKVKATTGPHTTLDAGWLSYDNAEIENTNNKVIELKDLPLVLVCLSIDTILSQQDSLEYVCSRNNSSTQYRIP